MTRHPTQTVAFSTQAEAVEWLALLGYVRAPLRGPVARYNAVLVNDDGGEYVSLAHVAERHADGGVTLAISDYGAR